MPRFSGGEGGRGGGGEVTESLDIGFRLVLRFGDGWDGVSGWVVLSDNEDETKRRRPSMIENNSSKRRVVNFYGNSSDLCITAYHAHLRLRRRMPISIF